MYDVAIVVEADAELTAPRPTSFFFMGVVGRDTVLAASDGMERSRERSEDMTGMPLANPNGGRVPRSQHLKKEAH